GRNASAHRLRSAAKALAFEHLFEIFNEATNHSDAVFDLRRLLVMRYARNGAMRPEIKFIAEKGEARPVIFSELFLPRPDQIDDFGAPFVCDRREKFAFLVMLV